VNGALNVSSRVILSQTDVHLLTVDRVKYFRDRSARNRAREEKEILESEMAQTTLSFMVSYKAWSEIGKQETEKNLFARAAYAYKQAEIYARLAEDSKAIQAKAVKKEEIYQRWCVLLFIFRGGSTKRFIYTGSKAISSATKSLR
jgi:hypothetical protein